MMKKSTFIIAEAGVNHNGDVNLAHRLIDVAKDANADAVKFQTFLAEEIATPHAQKANYQKQNTAGNTSQLSMLQKLQLSQEAHFELQQHCNDIGIEFLSTPFDLLSLKFLVEELGIQTIKISSGDITNGPLLHTCARAGGEIILSTGMSTMEEIQEALAVLAHGYSCQQLPCKRAFDEALSTAEGQESLQRNVTLLHCTSQYPAPVNELNLNAIPFMKQAFGLPTGYSDHSEGIVASIAAVAIGADLIEKHITLDKNMVGPDHKASLNPGELSALVTSVRIVERSMGEPQKTLQSSERETMELVRKSIVAARDIHKGEIFSLDNLTFKRPCSGESPMSYWEFLGEPSGSDYNKDDIISL
jgi:N-acetylneuraminate synthase